MPKSATRKKTGAVTPSSILDIALDQAMRLLASEPALAEEQAREVLRVYADEARAYLVLANALRLQGDADGARRAAEQALAIDEAYADAHIERGIALIALDNRAGAVEAFETALAFDSENAAAWRALGDQLSILGQSEAAERAYAQHAKVQGSDCG